MIGIHEYYYFVDILMYEPVTEVKHVMAPLNRQDHVYIICQKTYFLFSYNGRPAGSETSRQAHSAPRVPYGYLY